VQPNLIDHPLFDAPVRARDGKCNILISGTPTHSADWVMIEKPLRAILEKYKGSVRAYFFGACPAEFIGHPWVEVIGFQADYLTYAKTLRSLQIHLALIPLRDTLFNRAKSNIKWLEYSAAGIPGIYSDVTPYSSCIEDGTTGILVGDSQSAWQSAIEDLVDNPNRAAILADRAKAVVRQNYSIEARLPSYGDLFEDISGRGRNLRAKLIRANVQGNDLWQWVDRAMERHILWRFRGPR
jgi:glycosyltransferase involved in cell wall biosynthesis